MMERIFHDYNKAYGLQFVVLRYFNVAGADPAGDIGESHVPETHLVPLVLDAASGQRAGIRVFGTDYGTPDGSCIRDYIHVSDLADAHFLALKYLPKEGKIGFFNLENRQGTSVFEVIAAVKKVTRQDFAIIHAGRRSGNPAVLVGSSKKARLILGWKPRYLDIEQIVEHAWNWHMNKQF